MWTFLYQLASPQRFYERAQRLNPWFAVLAAVCLSVGLVWGLFFAPPDYQQGDTFRILYVHVPCAFLSMSLYALMGFLSVLLIVWRIKLAGMLICIVAEVGAMITLLALLTGCIWGKPMWGAYWVWDARLTSELILFFLFAAILATHAVYDDQEQGDRLVALLTLVGLVDLPIIHYSVYWWNTLHQGATLSLFSKPKIHVSMLPPLLLVLVGLASFCAFLILYHARQVVLVRERRQHWVRGVVT